MGHLSQSIWSSSPYFWNMLIINQALRIVGNFFSSSCTAFSSLSHTDSATYQHHQLTGGGTYGWFHAFSLCSSLWPVQNQHTIASHRQKVVFSVISVCSEEQLYVTWVPLVEQPTPSILSMLQRNHKILLQEIPCSFGLNAQQLFRVFLCHVSFGRRSW